MDEKFRKFKLDTEKIVLAGKNAKQNDLLVNLAKPNDSLLHTVEPGSPFINLGQNPSKDEIKQASVFCAEKSQFWRDNKKDVFVHLFLKSSCTKNPKDKDGLWHVKKILKTIKIKKSEIIKFENNKNVSK